MGADALRAPSPVRYRASECCIVCIDDRDGGKSVLVLPRFVRLPHIVMELRSVVLCV